MLLFETGIELQKSVASVVDTTGDGFIGAGDTINYTFTVTNTGALELTNVAVTDPLLVAPNGSITGSPIASIAAGASDSSVTGTYIIQAADVTAGGVENVATASGSTGGRGR